MTKRSEDKLKYFKGSLLAGAAGDALGYAVEFITYDGIISKYGEKGICAFDLKGGKAIISDDTQMTLFTANGILFGDTRGKMRGIAAETHSYVYLAYLDWLSTQGYVKPYDKTEISWLLKVPELFSSRAPGNTCLSALASGKVGTINEPLNTSKGCGSVMRIAPYGLFYGDLLKRSPQRFINEAMAIGAITHGNPFSHLTCALASCVLAKVIYENYDSLEKAVVDSLPIVEKYTPFVQFGEFSSLIRSALELTKNDRRDEENIRDLGEGWVAEEALAIAIYCACKYENDLEKCLIAAVNHSGDSDSTGAIAGNLLGAFLGVDAIPEKFLKDLELKEVIEEIAADLSTGCPMSEYGSEFDYDWSEKYIKKRRPPKPLF